MSSRHGMRSGAGVVPGQLDLAAGNFSEHDGLRHQFGKIDEGVIDASRGAHFGVAAANTPAEHAFIRNAMNRPRHK